MTWHLMPFVEGTTVHVTVKNISLPMLQWLVTRFFAKNASMARANIQDLLSPHWQGGHSLLSRMAIKML